MKLFGSLWIHFSYVDAGSFIANGPYVSKMIVKYADVEVSLINQLC